MITLVFLDPNVFNVLKYVIMSLTISFAADVLLDTISGYSMVRKLVTRGWARPCHSSIRVRLRRGAKIRKAGSSVTVLLAAVSISILEMALEFSTGAQSVWIRRTEVVRVSTQASNVSSLLQSDSNYILKMRFALERVENTCYSVSGKWYFPVLFNMTNSTEFHGLGKAALCPSNFSENNFVEAELAQSSFLAQGIAGTNIWNASDIRVGRDVFESEETFPLNEIPNVRIGSTQNYSFLAVNFSRDFRVEGSERALSGFSDTKHPKAFHTANFTVESGKTLECLMKTKWVRDEENGTLLLHRASPEVCLVPTTDDRMVLGLFDDIQYSDGFQLVMSVALKNIKSFHDLNVIRFLPWMVGINDGLHTYREIGILTVLCGRMVRDISVDGYQDLEIEVGAGEITVPTVSIWGIVLLVVGTMLIVIAKVWLSISRRKFQLKGNLNSVKGVAEHWLQQNEDSEDNSIGKGAVVFVLDGGSVGVPSTVKVGREHEVRRKVDTLRRPV